MLAAVSLSSRMGLGTEGCEFGSAGVKLMGLPN